MTTLPSNDRRNLFAGGLALLVAPGAISMLSGKPGSGEALTSTPYMPQLRRALDIPEPSDDLTARIHRAIEEPVSVAVLIRRCVDRLKATIGDQWDTAEHSVPSLVEEDLQAGRIIRVGGLALSHVEVALLVGQ